MIKLPLKLMQLKMPEEGTPNPPEQPQSTESPTREELLQRITELNAWIGGLQEENQDLRTFAKTAAHELRALLTVIQVCADILRDILRGDYSQISADDLDIYSNGIFAATRRIDQLINDLLLLARASEMEVEPEPLYMANIIEEALDRLAPMCKEHHANIALPETWPEVLGYAPWIKIIWTNLISNALKYGGQPPRVELGTERQDDGFVRLWVRDNGDGISEQDQVELFKPFTRLEQPRDGEIVKGTGLGLHIVRQIVERLGGQVGVESEIGEGSTFYFTLPALPFE